MQIRKYGSGENEALIADVQLNGEDYSQLVEAVLQYKTDTILDYDFDPCTLSLKICFIKNKSKWKDDN